MLAGAAMASAPAVRTAPAGARAGTGFRGAVGSRAGLIAPSARRPAPRAAPKPVRAGEALDWENDDFVPASKANKKKKSKGGNAAQKQKQKSKPAAPKAEALDWENDDFVPAGKAKKNKKKPKKGGDDGAAQDEPAPPPVIAEVPDWENEEFVPASKKKDKKGKKGKQASEPVASVIEPAVEPEPVVEETAAAAAAAETAKAAEAAAAAAVAQAEAAAAAAAAAKAKAEAEAAAVRDLLRRDLLDPLADAGTIGRLTVHVQSARDLIAADSNGLSDPYVIVKAGKQTKRSKYIAKTLNPTWNQNLVFNGNRHQEADSVAIHAAAEQDQTFFLGLLGDRRRQFRIGIRQRGREESVHYVLFPDVVHSVFLLVRQHRAA